MTRAACAFALIALATVGRSEAAPVTVALEPPTTSLTLTVFAMGLFPLPGRFNAFFGTLTIDPAHPSTCQVVLTVQVASLHMADPGRTQTALGPKLLDAAHFPALLYTGACHEGGAEGRLTMHGVTRQLALSTNQDGRLLSAQGSLRREDYGVSGLAGLVGRRVDLLLSVNLPAPVAAALQRD